MITETRLVFDVSTPQLALQARRKISALIIGGWDVISMEEYEIEDQGQFRIIREVIILGDEDLLNLPDEE